MSSVAPPTCRRPRQVIFCMTGAERRSQNTLTFRTVLPLSTHAWEMDGVVVVLLELLRFLLCLSIILSLFALAQQRFAFAKQILFCLLKSGIFRDCFRKGTRVYAREATTNIHNVCSALHTCGPPFPTSQV